MKFGFIGAGSVAQVIAKHLLQHGHEVVLSNSKGPDSLQDLTASLGIGARAGTPQEAAQQDYVVLAVIWPQVADALAAVDSWRGRVLIYATNRFESLNPRSLGDLSGPTSSEIVAQHAPGARVVKLFNTVPMTWLQDVSSDKARIPTCVVAMEACCGAHHLGRIFVGRGHTVRLMSPEYVRPYVKAQKNDDRDAESNAEAASRPTMRFVELKSDEQQDIQTLHRVRSRLVAQRTTLINQLRAILLERGIIFATGRRKLEQAVDDLLGDEATGLSPRMRQLTAALRDEWKLLDEKIQSMNAEFIAIARNNEAMRRLTTIPGIGVLNATALVAAIGNADSFRHARDLGAWLGLVPQQHSTGGKARLLGITKRGNTYLRMLFGSWSACRFAHAQPE